MCETWLTSDVSSSYVDLPGFRFFRSDVVGPVKKHGVGLYVAQRFVAVPCEVDVPNVLSVYVEEWDLYVVVAYRPPSCSQMKNEALMSFLFNFTTNKNVVILGDFNLPSLKWGAVDMLDQYISPLDSNYYDSFAIAGLTQWVEQPTFLPSGNVLDLLLTTDADVVGSIDVLPPLPRCHHSPLVFEYVAVHCWMRRMLVGVSRDCGLREITLL